MDKKSDINVINTKLDYINKSIEEIKGILSDLDKKYVTQESFQPVKSIVYGFVSLILVTIIGALLTVVVKAN